MASDQVKNTYSCSSDGRFLLYNTILAFALVGHSRPRPADKAAALMHSLALNHPFVDGNKRVAAFAAIVFAESNGHEFLTTPDELVETTLAVAEGKMAVEALAIWFRQRLRSVE